MPKHSSLGKVNTHRRRRHHQDNTIIIVLISAIVVIILLIIGILYINKALPPIFYPGDTEESSSIPEQTSPAQTQPTTPEETTEVVDGSILSKAATQAAMYDYDAAIATLQAIPDYDTYEPINELIAQYETDKTKLVKWADNTQITHIFFHSLIVDTDLCFKSAEASQYNQVMTTVDEFNKIMQAMYEKGYVLVGLHDIAEEVQQEDGSFKMVTKPIYLPAGKIPFVLSEDDVCYYEYMVGDGFASRLVVGEDGYVTTQMDLPDGSTVTGSYDVVPILEDFIREHPDFSYRGAKGILAMTGYNGIFGYRTSEYSYGAENPDLYTNPNIEEDRQKAAVVAQALRDTGWELSSHSWGHRNLHEYDEASKTGTNFDQFKWDCDRWEAEVESIIGPTDIILFPFGSDIGSWRGYDETNERYNYMNSLGFRYYCNVDSAVTWVQIKGDYFRQGRRNLDGQRMYQSIVTEKDYLSDLFDSKEIFDSARPTPVPGV